MATKKKPETSINNDSIGSIDTLDKHWHLAQTDTEIAIAELESTLYRVYAAFERWTCDCAAAAANIPLSGTENSVLHVIRMKERPKSISEISRLLNRDDIPNLQYAIRKLLSANLIEKHRGNKKKGICYKTTEQGMQVTDNYAKIRKSLLMPLIESVSNWENQSDSTCRTLDLIKGMYDSAALTVSQHRKHLED